MAVARKPFQGVMNVVRFNWHFYVIATVVVATLLAGAGYLSGVWSWLLLAASSSIIVTTLVSLLATYYIYDLSDLYAFSWLDDQPSVGSRHILNVNAGFDETSVILAEKYPHAQLHIADFYDPELHTEVSIKRARKAYPPHPDTVKVETGSLPYEDDTFDAVFVIFAAHEVRDEEERKQFFRELRRVAQPNASIYVTEHLRDTNNFLVYTIGFIHFYPHSAWLRVFQASQLTLLEEVKTTPFVSTFILENNGTTN